ncbi:MAG: hypothetical protein ACJAVK_000479 [Akkermansiaceae bacterium]|jgi:hypothetical protein
MIRKATLLSLTALALCSCKDDPGSSATTDTAVTEPAPHTTRTTPVETPTTPHAPTSTGTTELALEKDSLKFGFIKLTDCAPIVIAKEKGFFEAEGFSVEVIAQPNWKQLLDNAITVSNEIWEGMQENDENLQSDTPPHPITADSLKPIVDAAKNSGKQLPMVFPVSTHNYDIIRNSMTGHFFFQKTDKREMPDFDGSKDPTIKFIDGIEYDGKKPLEYLKTHAIRNKN